MATFRILNAVSRLSLSKTTEKLRIVNSYHQTRLLSSKLLSIKEMQTDEAGKKKKTAIVPKITLVAQDESIQIVTLEEARKISDRRNLKLVKIVDLDTKTQRPIFKLMTGHEYHAADLKNRELKKEKKSDSFLKGEKLLLLTSRITEHDLNARIKKTLQWLSKRYEVRVVISGNSEETENCVSIFHHFSTCIKFLIIFII